MIINIRSNEKDDGYLIEFNLSKPEVDDTSLQRRIQFLSLLSAGGVSNVLSALMILAERQEELPCTKTAFHI